MKLNNPITLTINSVESAVLIARLIGWSTYAYDAIAKNYDAPRPNQNGELDALFAELTSGLKNQGIDYSKWSEEPAMFIGHRQVKFFPDGSLEVGCQAIPPSLVDEIIQWRAKAMRKG